MASALASWAGVCCAAIRMAVPEAHPFGGHRRGRQDCQGVGHLPRVNPSAPGKRVWCAANDPPHRRPMTHGLGVDAISTARDFE